MLASTLMDRLESEFDQRKTEFLNAKKAFDDSKNAIISNEYDIQKCIKKFAKLRLSSGVRIQYETVNKVLKRRRDQFDLLVRQKSEAENSIESTRATLEIEERRCNEHRKNAEAVYESDTAYSLALKRSNKDDDVLAGAEALKADIEIECKRKLPVYTQSPFFSYLLNRMYGQEDYKGKWVAKNFDRWLANKINYKQNLSNYTMLKQMMVKAEQRVDDLAVAAEASRDLFNQIKASIDHSVGYQQATNEYNKVKTDLENLLTDASSINELIKHHADNSDDHFVFAENMLSDKLQGLSLDDLREKAEETETLEDDKLVDQLERLHCELESNESQLEDDERRMVKAERKYNKAKELLEGAKNRSYGSSSYRYSSSMDLDGLITGYMLGRLDTGSVFSQMSSCRTRVASSSSSSSFSNSSSFGSSSFSSSSSFGGGGFSTTDSF